MRIRKHSRITALVLALVMILPLISIPTFAEDAVAAPAINWSQNFDEAKQVSDVITYSSTNGLAATKTSLEGGALKREYGAVDDGKYYAMTNYSTTNDTYGEITGGSVENGKLTGGTVSIKGSDGTKRSYKIEGAVVPTNMVRPKDDQYKATLTGDKVPANVYIVNGRTKDAIIQGHNIGVPNYVSNPAISKDSYSKVWMSADYLFSKDLTYVKASDAPDGIEHNTVIEVTWAGTSGRVDIAKIYVYADYIEVHEHGDAGGVLPVNASNKTAGSSNLDGNGNNDYYYIRVPKGNWFTLTAAMDLTTGAIQIYTNGEYCHTVVDQHLKSGLKENTLNLGNFNRGASAYHAPDAMAGYFMVDNVTVSTAPKAYTVADFKNYKGLASSDFATNNGSGISVQTYGKNFTNGALPSELEAVTEENGNTYLKYNYDLDLSLKKESWYIPTTGSDGEVLNDANPKDGIVDVYAYNATAKTRWEYNTSIKSYDDKTKTLTMVDGSTYTVTGKTSGGKYGTFTDGEGTTITLATPRYAVRNVFGGVNGQMDKNISLHIPPFSHETTDEIHMTVDYLIEPDSIGKAQLQFYQIIRGGAKADWANFAYIDLATGGISFWSYAPDGSVDAGNGATTATLAYLPIGAWCELGFTINLKNGHTKVYVDGVELASYGAITVTRDRGDGAGKVGRVHTLSCIDLGENIIFSRALDTSTLNYEGGSGFIPAKMEKKDESLNAKGSIAIDNVTFMPVESREEYIVNNTFNNNRLLDLDVATNSKNLTGFNSVALQTIEGYDSKIVKAFGEQAWKIDWDVTNKSVSGHGKGVNIDKNNYQKHAAISYTTHTSVVFETDFLIEHDAYGQYQCQLPGTTTDPDKDGVGTKIGDGWGPAFNINFTGQTAYFKGRNKTATLARGLWNTVSMVLNYQTGELSFYVNGKLVESDYWQNGDAAGSVNLATPANKWNIGKLNTGFGTTGTIYIDNIRAFEGTEPSAYARKIVNKEVADFEEFVAAKDGTPAGGNHYFNGSVPSLLTYKKEADGNTALRLAMGAGHSHNEWAYVNTSYTVAKYGVAFNETSKKITIDGEECTATVVNEELGIYMAVKEDGTKYYVAPSDYVEAASNGLNTGVGMSFKHDTFSYKDYDTVVLQADYFIEKGSTGIIESQFGAFKYAETEGGADVAGGWLQLFQIRVSDGLILGSLDTKQVDKKDPETGEPILDENGDPVKEKVAISHNGNLRLELDDWTTIKVVAHLKTGEFYVYANDVLARIYDCGKDFITIGTDASDWSIAKVQRHNNILQGPYQGGIMIDEVSVKAYTVTTTFGGAFLTEEAQTSYLEDLIVSTGTASIRFNTPAGLRFASVVNTQKLAHLKAVLKNATVNQGTLITPEQYLMNNEIDTEGIITRDILEKKEIQKLDVKFQGEYKKAPFIDENSEVSDAEKNYMVGSIVKIKEDNIPAKFAGIGYVEFVIGETTYGLYTTATIKSVEEVAGACWIAAEDAKAAGEENPYTDDQMLILEDYYLYGMSPDGIQ